MYTSKIELLKRNKRGFGSVELLLVLAVIILVAAAGFYLWHRQHIPKTAPPPPMQQLNYNNQVCNETDKSCLEAVFAQIKIPGTFAPVSKTWYSTGDDNKNIPPHSWIYIYTVPNDQWVQSNSDFIKSEIKAGFTFHTLEAGPDIATNKKANVTIIEYISTPQSGGPFTVRLMVR